MAQVDTPFDFIDWFRQGGKWTKEDGQLTEEAINQLENIVATSVQIFERTGGSTDAILSITNADSFETSTSSAEYHEHDAENEQIEDLIYIPPPIEQQESEPTLIQSWRVGVTKSSAVAVNRDWKDLREKATITLDANAKESDLIRTSIGDNSGVSVRSTIELRYAGKRGNTLHFQREGTSVDWCLFVDNNERFWRGV